MDLERLRALAGIEEGASYAEPKANHKVKSGAGTSTTANGKDHGHPTGMDMKKLDASKKTGNSSADYEKKTGGDVVMSDNKMKQHTPKSHKSDDKSGQGEHAKKSFASSEAHGKGKDHGSEKNHMDRVNKTTTAIKEMAETIMESDDAEATLAALIRELQQAGLEL
jgi:hypothetical protein